LLQQAERVSIAPLFDSLAVYETVNEYSCPAYLLASRWDTHEVAQVSTTSRVANHDGVPFCDDVLNSKLLVRKGGVEHQEELFVGFETLDSRRGSVKHDVRVQNLIEDCQILLI